MIDKEVRSLLIQKSNEFNKPSFIEFDPIFVPHQFSKKEDIEIAGFFSAIFAWGQRKTIINKGLEIMKLMDNDPFDFIISHSKNDLKNLKHFKHRTFNSEDCLYFVQSLNNIYLNEGGLEKAMLGKSTIEESLNNFSELFFKNDKENSRTRKHIARPNKNSACKRLNMFLRWMVRQDKNGVDFGIWKSFNQKDLICPLDVHVFNTSHQLGLIRAKKPDWNAAIELTENLKCINDTDPVIFDFALFGLGIEKYFI